MSYLGAVIRFALATVLLMLIGYILPGFGHFTFGQAVLAALVIGALSYVIPISLGQRKSTYVRGITAFIVSVVVIGFVEFAVPHFHGSLLGVLLAAVVIGFIGFSIPNTVA